MVETQSTSEYLSQHYLQDPKYSQQHSEEAAKFRGSGPEMGVPTWSRIQQQKAASDESRNHEQGPHALSPQMKEHRSVDAVQPHKFHKMGAKFAMPGWKLTPGQFKDWSQLQTRSGVLKGSWMHTEKISLEGRMLNASTGQFGSPDHIISFEACFEDGSPISNSFFLPSAKDKLEEILWNWRGLGKAHMSPPTKVDQRTLCFSLTKDRGETLEYCTDATDILECILHSMLGWLSLYQNGFLHRDISIGNIIKLKSPLERKDFSALSVNKLLFEPPNSKILTSFEAMRAAAGNDQARISIIDLAQEVDKRAKGLTSGQMCKAIWIDGDMSADMSGYFKRSHDGTISGTYEFLSERLRDAVREGLHYVHSPADDLESFFWVGLWSTLRNKNFSRTSTTEQRFSKDISTDLRQKVAVDMSLRMDLITAEHPKQPYSDLLRAMTPVLSEWYTALNKLQIDYEVDENVNDDEEKLMLRFHHFAYRGVLEFIEVFEKHRGNLQKKRV
ncbi:hypothetical protein F5880DRAFT_1676105 [Lentinula raphanica]|nr:hypothetical protein F5880DRAFT_1676105 [Lentinula raphanica]